MKTHLFSKAVQFALAMAKTQAENNNNRFCGAGYLLFGMIFFDITVASQALQKVGVNLSELREILKAKLPVERDRFNGEVRFTPRVIRTLESADKLRQVRSHSIIDTGHVLIEVLNSRTCPWSQILRDHRVSLGSVAEATRGISTETN